MYTDTHCHITCDELYERLPEVLENMSNVDCAMIMCTNEEEFERALKIKESDARFKVAFGWFPGDAKEITPEKMAYLEKVLASKKIDVLGEIGLDYYWDDSFKEEQKKLFIDQILLANAYHLPISIHMRSATADTVEILKEYAKTPVILHCFSGSKETMKELIKMGCYISFAGPITFKNAKGALECVKECDLDRILSETDSPYLTPVPFRGKRNEPKNVEFVQKKIAEIKELPVEVIQQQIAKNFQKIFS
jgi:TatD DNase family protein